MAPSWLGLADYIEYAAERHGDKIGEISILTNGRARRNSLFSRLRWDK
jgi:hypothetical protein